MRFKEQIRLLPNEINSLWCSLWKTARALLVGGMGHRTIAYRDSHGTETRKCPLTAHMKLVATHIEQGMCYGQTPWPSETSERYLVSWYLVDCCTSGGYSSHVLNLKPPLAQMTLPVHQPLSGVQSIAITPAISSS